MFGANRLRALAASARANAPHGVAGSGRQAFERVVGDRPHRGTLGFGAAHTCRSAPAPTACAAPLACDAPPCLPCAVLNGWVVVPHALRTWRRRVCRACGLRMHSLLADAACAAIAAHRTGRSAVFVPRRRGRTASSPRRQLLRRVAPPLVAEPHPALDALCAAHGPWPRGAFAVPVSAWRWRAALRSGGHGASPRLP